MKTPPSPSLNAVLDESTGQQLEYRQFIKTIDKDKWENGCSKEFARISNGRSKDGTPGSNTVEWIHRHQIPPGKKPTYLGSAPIFARRKLILIEYAAPLGATLFNTKGPLLHQRHPLQLLRFFSIVSFPYLVPSLPLSILKIFISNLICPNRNT